MTRGCPTSSVRFTVAVAAWMLLPALCLAGQHTEAKIVTHASNLHAKCLPCACTNALGPYACGVTPIDVTGEVNYGYAHLYLQLVDLDPALGVNEVSFGLKYDEATNSGVDGVIWQQCLPSAT